MATLSKTIVTIINVIFVVTVYSQQQPNQQQRAPVLKDWFLSTGHWQNDPQLYVCEFGTGHDTVIMLHGGWGGDHSGFMAALSGLTNQFHFILYDQRGSLRSPFPDSLISFEQHIEDVERLRKELNMDKLTIVGHSMGAVLASAYAFRYPARIQKLILLSPAPLKNPVPDDEKKLGSLQQAALQQFLNRPEVTRELEKYNLNRPTPALSSREETMKFRIGLYKRMLYDVSKCKDVPGGRALYKARVFELTAKTYPPTGWDYVAAFKSQSYPVHIIVGDHDFLDFGCGLSKKWSSEVPRIKLQVIKNAGHILWLDQPEEFEKQLANHLRQ
jgi:proline iminopeptidase